MAPPPVSGPAAMAALPVTVSYGAAPQKGMASRPLVITSGFVGRVTLVAGVAVVNDPKITALSNVQITVQALGTVTSPKAVGVTARIAGTSYTITSADATDTSIVSYHVFY